MSSFQRRSPFHFMRKEVSESIGKNGNNEKVIQWLFKCINWYQLHSVSFSNLVEIRGDGTLFYKGKRKLKLHATVLSKVPLPSDAEGIGINLACETISGYEAEIRFILSSTDLEHFFDSLAVVSEENNLPEVKFLLSLPLFFSFTSALLLACFHYNF